MHILEVKDKKTSNKFIALPRHLYKNDPHFICPLDNDLKGIFDPKLNNFHSHGVCKRWITKNNSGQTTGRIAAFINYKKNKNSDFITGGIGFFECIDDEKTAFLLFDTAKQWLQQNNAKAIDAPVNFGENDKYWGLLVEALWHQAWV